jgi:hypothetical protein
MHIIIYVHIYIYIVLFPSIDYMFRPRKTIFNGIYHVKGNFIIHVDPLRKNDHEISNYTTAVTRQRNVTRCYKQDK